MDPATHCLDPELERQLESERSFDALVAPSSTPSAPRSLFSSVSAQVAGAAMHDTPVDRSTV